MNIEEALGRHRDRLMGVADVTGVGIGSKGGKPAIVVMVKRLAPEVKARIPRTLEGHDVVVEQSGEITAL